MPYKQITTLGVTIGSPFNGAVPGTSVTVNSVVMRGSTCHSGRFNRLYAEQIYSPLYSTTEVRPQVYTNINPTTILAPTLPVVLPVRDAGLVEARVRIVRYVSITSSSFSAPTVNSVVMRASKALTADFGQFIYGPSTIQQQNFRRTIATTAVDLNIFGMINNKLYMDY